MHTCSMAVFDVAWKPNKRGYWTILKYDRIYVWYCRNNIYAIIWHTFPNFNIEWMKVSHHQVVQKTNFFYI